MGEVALLVDVVDELSYAGGLDDFSVIEEGSGFLPLFGVCKAEVELRDEGYPGG